MTNGEYINKISDWLVILCRIIEKRKRRQRYDITHDAEDVFAKLLNMVYGWNLENANRRKPGFPAGDLIDDKNGLFVQVTSNKDAGTKVRDTVNGFVKIGTDGSRFCEKYARLIILLASYGEDKKDKELKQQYQKAARNMLEKDSDVAQLCTDRFDPETDIWDCDTIVGELEDFSKYSVKALKEIISFLGEQIQPLQEFSSSSETADYPENAYHLRRLADNLWINWKTGCLTENPETALSGSETGGAGKPFVTLSPKELRLLSVLVQGEGAVVSWEEICERADLKTGRSGEEDAKKAAGNAVRTLLEKVQELSRIIDPEKDEKGCRISLCGWGSANSYGDSEKIKDDDWVALRKGFEGDNPEKRRDYAKAWFRRYYAQLAGSFENRITNARTDGMGGKVFGTYTMIAAYANARTYADGGDGRKTEAMLDRIEKWYRKRPEKVGRLLVLHGQPGDGKTTFCKKAVYAHRFEGWLTDAPCVLRISLNPSESSILAAGENRLTISNAFCLRGPEDEPNNPERFYCSMEDIPKNTLIILDGYDELAARLGGVIFEGDEKDESPFYSFLKATEKLAESDERNWRIIITSRTMCIRHELKKGIGTVEEDVKFAPLTHSQQERMLERMAELEDEQAAADSLLAYRETLHELWENEDMDRLLRIPALFRMIVACRFKDAETGYSEAVLYSKLFYNLMVHRGKDPAAIKKALGEYETIAARIFNYQEDTCPYEEKPESEELIYLFLTKGDGEEGRLGFLHGSFRQFFLARYIVSGIQAASEEKRTEFVKFFSSLRAARIEGDDAAAFTYIGQITRLQGTANDPFGMKKITKETLEGCLGRLNDEKTYGEGIAKGEVFKRGPEAEKGGLPGAENAVFNLLTALGIMERARTGKDGTERTQPGDGADRTRPCKDEDKSICFGTYKNICDYLRKGDYNGIDLSSLDFSGAELEGAYLKGAKLSGTILSGAILSDANLVGADLSKANLTGAVFTAANLSGASLEEAVVTDGAEKIISFRRENLKGATLKDAVLGDVDFLRADLSMSNLSGAKLIRANLLEANISGACLNGAHLDGANLKRADLSESRLTETQLPGAHMEKASLKGANFWKANLAGAHLEEARLDGAVLAEAQLTNAHLERASLEQAYLCAYPGAGTFKWHGKVCGADPKCDADLKGANLAGADFAGAFLSEEGYRQVKAYEKAGGCALGLPGKAPDGSIIQDKKRYRNLSVWVIGKSIINPMTEALVPYGIYQGETLLWRVLRRECGKVLLITEKVIEIRVYHPEGKVITWEDCDLRRWLNEEFVKEAFTDEERERIACVNNQNPDNKRYGKAGGRPTEDRVFALSIDEAEAYFGTEKDRTAVLTDYAFRVLKARDKLEYARRTERGVLGWWWLRSPGNFCNYAACVVPGGGVLDFGYFVIHDDVGVRPALWLNL
ncbi:MAG: pentapeptide repeat-containing protein [Lachnospiraceae bacterium]|nr:pentapeptide repeat-containing protein [Lachnospiraceae bacterium]